MDYESSWTRPGEGFLKEAVTMTMQPANPKDRVGDAANRRKEYYAIFVNGMKPAQMKEFIKDFKLDPKWLDKKYPWRDVGRNRKDFEKTAAATVRVTNYKKGDLGGSQVDIVMVQKQIKKWIEANGGGNVNITSQLNRQT